VSDTWYGDGDCEWDGYEFSRGLDVNLVFLVSPVVRR
jgi:hypothetical protein